MQNTGNFHTTEVDVCVYKDRLILGCHLLCLKVDIVSVTGAYRVKCHHKCSLNIFHTLTDFFFKVEQPCYVQFIYSRCI